VRALYSDTEWNYEHNVLKLAPSLSMVTVKVIQSAYFPALATMLFSMCERDTSMRTAVLAHVTEFAHSVNSLDLFERTDPIFNSIDCLAQV
jgi:hypothetical protein